MKKETSRRAKRDTKWGVLPSNRVEKHKLWLCIRNFVDSDLNFSLCSDPKWFSRVFRSMLLLVREREPCTERYEALLPFWFLGMIKQTDKKNGWKIITNAPHKSKKKWMIVFLPILHSFYYISIRIYIDIRIMNSHNKFYFRKLNRF